MTRGNPDIENWSTPILNVLRVDVKESTQWTNEYLALHMWVERTTKRKHDLTESMKELLGRQNYCWTGSVRYWIWEDPDKAWRLFVSNKKGICFEVANTGMDVETAMAVWHNFLWSIGADDVVGIDPDTVLEWVKKG